MATLTALFFSKVPEDTKEFLRSLKRLLRHHLKERGLLHVAPRFLGCERGQWDEVALDELAQDAYEFIMRRIHSLTAQQSTRPNIDGLLRLDLKHFLTEAQHRHDKLGWAVYQNVRGGLDLARNDGAVTISDEEIRNSTVVTYSSWTSSSVPADRAGVESAFFGQGDRSELVDALTEICEEAQKDVCTRVKGMPDEDASIDGFECGDLIEPLKTEVRGARGETSLFGVDEVGLDEDGDRAAPVPVTPADDPDMLSGHLLETVRTANITEKRRTKLLMLAEDMIANRDDWNQAESARRLGVKPQTLNDWVSQLRDLYRGAVL